MEKVKYSEAEMQTWREVAPKMFERLNNYVGDGVQYVYWMLDSKRKSRAILTKVDENDSVMFFRHKLPLIGNKCAVISINSLKTGELLYYNPFVDVADYLEKTSDEIMELREKLFSNHECEQDDLESKIDKYLLVRGGTLVVKPELVEEWYQYVEENEKIGFNQVTEIVLNCLQRLQQEAFCGEVFKIYAKQEMEKDIMDAINDGVVYFSSRGQEYENYLQNKGILVGDKRKNGSFIKRVLECK